MFPIEKPGKSGSIGGHRSDGGSFDHGKKKVEEKKERRFGWNYNVTPKPKDEQQKQDNKYRNVLLGIKNKTSGINSKKYESVVKPWDFNVVKGDPSQTQYGNALASLKNSIKGKK
ncbi:hypothetical protein M0R01_02880 [bacterium]|nr:hypothetical protein [bacterium]